MALMVKWTEPASDRFDEIYDYLKGEAGKRTALKIVGKITAHTKILAQNPHAGPIEELLTGRGKDHRYLVQGNYKIIYRIENETVWIITLFDCRQNPEKMPEEAEK